MRRSLVAASFMLVLGAAACSGDDSPPGVSLGPNVSITATVKPTIGGVIGQANAAECSTERDTMETALASYEALTGTPATDENDLIGAGAIREPSVLYDVKDGHLVLAPNSPCPAP